MGFYLSNENPDASGHGVSAIKTLATQKGIENYKEDGLLVSAQHT